MVIQQLAVSEGFTSFQPRALKTQLHLAGDFDPSLDKALRTDVFQLYGPPVTSKNGREVAGEKIKAPPPIVFYDSKRRRFMQGFKSSVQTVKDISRKTLSAASKRASIQAPEVTTSQLESVVTNAKEISPFKKVDQIQLDALERSQNEYLSATSAGLATAVTMVPEAIAFAFAAGVNPLVGLWTSVSFGVTAAAMGGRPGLISGASGACAIVVAGLCAAKGPQYLPACALMAGALQIVGGVLGVGKFIRLVPHPVMLGFVNGLTILMAKAQLKHFAGLSLLTPPGMATFGLVSATIALMKTIPMISTVVPPSLGAVAIVSMLSAVFKLPVATLASVAGASTFAGGLKVLPKVGFPGAGIPLSLATIQTVLPYAITMAAVGLIESLLAMQVVDGMVDDGKRGSVKKETIAQGAGNIASAAFGGIGGSAVLGQSIINVQSGGAISKWSGISAGLLMAAGIVLGAPVVGSIPIASLVGVMLLVCQSTFSWSSLRLINKIPKLDAIILAMTSIVTVKQNLAVAVIYGTIGSALGFAWKKSKMLRAEEFLFEDNDVKLYALKGPLFFGSADAFGSIFEVESDPSKVIIDFSECRVHDHSALDAVCRIADKYDRIGKQVIVRRVSSDTAQLLRKLYRGGSLIVETDTANDPHYQVAEDSDLYDDVRIG